ncbi:Uncharacterized protein dnm_045520 [Desulfonema magnum]|uniref:Uncharacterized protein n=1 Tax=Desulfonema magnum TaxID=45655 RepID=A0A975BN29_9BACT|nr:Uncharacterized protein dnm_045520 [Desulfonema magnum]
MLSPTTSADIKYPARSFSVFYQRCPLIIPNMILKNICPGKYLTIYFQYLSGRKSGLIST